MLCFQSANDAFTGIFEIPSRTVFGLKRRKKSYPRGGPHGQQQRTIRLAVRRTTQPTSKGPCHPCEGPHCQPRRGHGAAHNRKELRSQRRREFHSKRSFEDYFLQISRFCPLT
ncbi:unnamed protein product [Haemonchus placei]|uniref:Homeobox domain-containing protein n=1 Tax=Haemonchus placei TaxID=6290 RepID=A0A0N4VUL4_HAEPC|nr:unnamed protein product [Haemonchus placei]